MRIDNIAWDIEPDIVKRFLPPRSLPPDHPQPIHICIDRHDGRTKDYMYIEVASQAAAKRILQTRQNVPMPGGKATGGRTRVVTISQVTHRELLCELRPGSKAELIWLLELCEAALSTDPAPSPATPVLGRLRHQAAVSAGKRVHYIKYRQSPFHALMSIMSKLRGPESPAYWDVFYVASGAIALLATSLKSGGPDRSTDDQLLQHMSSLFDTCFGRRIAPVPHDQSP
ncbi:hypothetical protein VHUM_03332 [Vanrija humicola]|uniref:Uncharacterized protein n=1 Tax=Vanrija humicola TaxID=5417 RepID=A0A7D8YUB0_VANHU|nr:hypothetical protein VHUM_03332 [Vanrija humicola]